MSNLTELLQYIDPSSLSYQEWVNVGMALKHEGYSVYDWDNWSARDGARYHAGECVKKWESFREDTSILVTGGTIYQMAVERGYAPSVKQTAVALGWDDEISDDYIVIDSDRVEALPIMQPDDNWKPVNELIRYLDTLYNDEDIVGYVTKSWVNDAGKHVPTQGAYKKTAGQLISELRNCKGDIGAVMGDYDSEVGAWIRFNPLDGKGCKNSNVVEYRYALVECDNMDLAKQNALIHELELPVACLVYSGAKSVHAIVKVDAADYKEYRKRVDYLYKICKKNGLSIDEQNKNPSRLSRMPGIIRGNNKQFLIDTNIGKESWNEWQEWIESVNDDLPEPEALDSVWDNMPELSPPLIDHVLRQGHKMLIAGPSKAGKSFLQIEMCIAIAEGRKWLSWQCAQGRVMYVNLELDRPSCLHRFKDVYNAMGIPANNLQNIDIWNLRGNSIPMDKLAPKLIRRAAKKDYIAIVIDPIYKVITGDENSADQMAAFCNQFDLGPYIPEKNFALLGMAGLMSGVMHAPLTGIFLIAELTGGYDLFLALMIVSVSAYLTIIVFEPHSIYSMRLAKRGELLTHHKDKAVLTLMNVENVVETDFAKASPDMDLGQMVRLISKTRRNLFPVVDGQERLLGIVRMDDIRNIMFRQELYHRFKVEAFMVSPPDKILRTDTMDIVMRKFDDTKAWNLPVVDEDGRYMGFISKSKIFNNYRQVLVDFSAE